MGKLDSITTKLNNYHRTLKLKEIDLIKKRKKLFNNIQALRKNLQILKHLLYIRDNQNDLDSLIDFKFSKYMFLKAKLDCHKPIFIALGANVIVEFSIIEAYTFCKNALDKSKTNLHKFSIKYKINTKHITMMELYMRRLIKKNIKICIRNFKSLIKPIK